MDAESKLNEVNVQYELSNSIRIRPKLSLGLFE